MSKLYKVHPGMGFARVGPSTDGFFLAGERPGASPLDVDASGQDVAFRGHKDASNLMRRQGARFRVFEYERDDGTGELSTGREITASDATVRWTVSLASAKAAGPQMVAVIGADGKRTIVPGQSLRNAAPAGFDRDDLRATVTLHAEGRNTGPTPGQEPMAKFLGQDLFIGEARTDGDGRLIVLGGRGFSSSWTTPRSRLGEYLNNPGWYDDIADGSVDATVTFPGQASVDAVGAWVFTTPPDFAPDIVPVTTLFDIAEQAAGTPLPNPVTYPQDVLPILQRAATLFFVNERPVWKVTRDNLGTLQGLDDNGAGSAANRERARNDLLMSENQISDFRLTARQKQILDAWANGAFQPQPDPARAVPSEPSALDRASLEHCVGGGFFPGIEAGTVLRQPSIYSELGRLKRGSFQDHDDRTYTLAPGEISSRMACPWQADFVECSRTWWPAQRPDITGRTANNSRVAKWHRGIAVGDEEESEPSRLNMVAHFAQLGVILRTDAGVTEVGRDPALDTGV